MATLKQIRRRIRSVQSTQQITKAMKKVAGRLRLDLAQYRELAAFAQFGSDLDKTTRAQLTRGERMVEILKQDQYVPMDLAMEVAIIFAGINGYLDALPAFEVRRFEEELLKFLQQEYPDLLHTLAAEKSISDDLEKKLHAGVKAFLARFQPAKGDK
jgi:F-type H+/Na+-transporting ATPase subunit alpha